MTVDARRWGALAMRAGARSLYALALALWTASEAAGGSNTGGLSVPGELPATGQTSSGATIVFEGSPGTGAPPPTLGPFAMTPVPPGAPACTGILPPIPTPGGDLRIDPTDGSPHCIGAGWATWSHGYAGDVYFTGGTTMQTLTMPPGTGAVYFYVEPGPFLVVDCEAVAIPGGVSSGIVPIDGDSGARYFGFYDRAGGSIISVSVACETGFATGEIGWAAARVPGVGAELRGVSGSIAVCVNRTTRARDVIPLLGATAYECDVPGGISPGDSVLQLIYGTAK